MPLPMPFDEDARQERLETLALLDTSYDRRIDALTARALGAFSGASIAGVSLIDRDRQWFKSVIGLAVTETPRSISFCAHAILSSRTLVVPDARLDRRFAENPLVTGDLGLRFYAGEPILDGLGTLCVVGTTPRRPPQPNSPCWPSLPGSWKPNS